MSESKRWEWWWCAWQMYMLSVLPTNVKSLTSHLLAFQIRHKIRTLWDHILHISGSMYQQFFWTPLINKMYKIDFSDLKILRWAQMSSGWPSMWWKPSKMRCQLSLDPWWVCFDFFIAQFQHLSCEYSFDIHLTDFAIYDCVVITRSNLPRYLTRWRLPWLWPVSPLLRPGAYIFHKLVSTVCNF